MLIYSACLCCIILAPATTVIAAQPVVDATTGPEAAASPGLWSWLILIMLSFVSLLICRAIGIFNFSSQGHRSGVNRSSPLTVYLTIFLVGMLLPGILAAPAASVSVKLLPGDNFPQIARMTLPGILIDSVSVLILLIILYYFYRVREISDSASRNQVSERDSHLPADAENRRRTRLKIPSFTRKLPFPIRSVLVGIVGLLLTLPVALLAGLLGARAQEMITGAAPDPLSHQTLQLLAEVRPDQQIWIWLTFFLVVVPVPLLEEITYRFGLQGSFVKMTGSVLTGIIMTAAVFSTLHLGVVPAAALPELFILGVGFGLVYERSGMLSASIVMHGLFNALNIVSALLLN